MQTHASLHLNFDVQGDQTILRVRKQEPPLRVIRAFPIDTENQTLHHRNEVQRTLSQAIHTNGHYGNDASVGGSGRSAARVNTIAAEEATYAEHADGQTDRIQPVLVHLHNISGGVLGGDQLRLDVAVGPEAQVQLTSTGSTRIYRYRQGYPITTQSTHMTVEAGGLLEYLPDTLIPYARSQYRQVTRIELADGAGLFYWEVVTPGREAKGECFDYDLLQIELDIVANGQPIAIERSRLEPARLRSTTLDEVGTGFDSLTRMADYRYFATFYICLVGVVKQQWLELEKLLDAEARAVSKRGQTVWGVSTLPAHGLCVRAVGTSSHAIQQQLPLFWQLAKETLFDQNAVMPRKMV